MKRWLYAAFRSYGKIFVLAAFAFAAAYFGARSAGVRASLSWAGDHGPFLLIALAALIYFYPIVLALVGRPAIYVVGEFRGGAAFVPRALSRSEAGGDANAGPGDADLFPDLTMWRTAQEKRLERLERERAGLKKAFDGLRESYKTWQAYLQTWTPARAARRLQAETFNRPMVSNTFLTWFVVAIFFVDTLITRHIFHSAGLFRGEDLQLGSLKIDIPMVYGFFITVIAMVFCHMLYHLIVPPRHDGRLAPPLAPAGGGLTGADAAAPDEPGTEYLQAEPFEKERRVLVAADPPGNGGGDGARGQKAAGAKGGVKAILSHPYTRGSIFVALLGATLVPLTWWLLSAAVVADAEVTRRYTEYVLRAVWVMGVIDIFWIVNRILRRDEDYADIVKGLAVVAMVVLFAATGLFNLVALVATKIAELMLEGAVGALLYRKGKHAEYVAVAAETYTAAYQAGYETAARSMQRARTTRRGPRKGTGGYDENGEEP